MSEDSPPPVPMPEVLTLSQKPSELPRYISCKHFIPDEFGGESTRIARQIHSELLREVTTNREKHIFRGVLDMETRTVVCSRRKAKGSTFHNMGVQSSEGFRFLPEEALLQCEYGVLEVFLEDTSHVPMCLQDLYHVMIPCISLEFYQVYCHLVRLGYSARRLELSDQKLSDTKVLSVKRPLSSDTDFHVAVLRNQRTFPSLKKILKIVKSVGKTCLKIAKVTDGKVDFYSLAVVDFPDASEIV